MLQFDLSVVHLICSPFMLSLFDCYEVNVKFYKVNSIADEYLPDNSISWYHDHHLCWLKKRAWGSGHAPYRDAVYYSGIT